MDGDRQEEEKEELPFSLRHLIYDPTDEQNMKAKFWFDHFWKEEFHWYWGQEDQNTQHCHLGNVFQEAPGDRLTQPYFVVQECFMCQAARPFTCSHANCIPQQFQYPNAQWERTRHRAYPGRIYFRSDPRKN